MHSFRALISGFSRRWGGCLRRGGIRRGCGCAVAEEAVESQVRFTKRAVDLRGSQSREGLRDA